MRGDQVVRLQVRLTYLTYLPCLFFFLFWLVGLTSIKGLSPRVILVPPDRTEAYQKEVVIKTEDAKTSSKKPASARPSATVKSEKKAGATGVPSWDSWEKDGKESSEQDLNKPSGDWIVQYVEKDDAKKNDSNGKSSKSNQSQNVKGKKRGVNDGKQNGKGGGKKRVVFNAKSAKGKGNTSGDNKTATDWEITENKGDSWDSNESAWAPADADANWQRQDGWEPEPDNTNNDENPENNTNMFGDWDASPGDNGAEENNNSEENDNMLKVPGAWPDTITEDDSDKDKSAKAEKAQAESKKDKKQANKQQGNPKGSKKPIVKGRGAKATVEFCVCEADNSVSFKSAQEIQENCQPGEWQQDEHGNPFFQRAQEENTSDTQAWEADNQGNSADTQTGFVDTPSPDDCW